MRRTILGGFSCLALAMLLLAPWARASTADDTTVPQSADEVRPLLIGAEVPAVTLHKTDGAAVDLHALVGEKPSILIFYRGGW